MLDDFDLQLEVSSIQDFELDTIQKGEPLGTIRQLVERARQLQQVGYQDKSYFCNTHMNNKDIREFCRVDLPGKELLTPDGEAFFLKRLGLYQNS